MEHLLQTAEALRIDGKPEWMQVYFPSTLSGLNRSISEGNWLGPRLGEAIILLWLPGTMGRRRRKFPSV
jgi:hypothetical protein